MAHEPVKDFKPFAHPKGDIMQFFGENYNLYMGCCGMIGHNGLDIVRPWGEPILCVESGIVVEVKEDEGGYGKHVRVLSKNNEWVYGHLSKITVERGQTIKEGEQIGKMGNTGFVVSGDTPYWKSNPYAGTHLHLGRRPCKPYPGKGSWDLSYPTGDKAILTSDYSAGFKGSTDPLPVFKSFKFNKNLWFGLKDADNIELQTRLGISPTDRNFGPKTLAAVIKFQKANGIPATGFVGELTRAKLNE